MHRLFQIHHLPPDEVYTKSPKHRAFMYASEELVIEAEEKEARKNARK